jgi:hypothetical protein
VHRAVADSFGLVRILTAGGIGEDLPLCQEVCQLKAQGVLILISYQSNSGRKNADKFQYMVAIGDE